MPLPRASIRALPPAVLPVVLIVVALITCSQRASTKGPDHARSLDALFGDLHARGLFDGAVVVGRGSEILWQKGFGYANIERQVRFSPDTAGDGASLAKTLTAALAVTLHEEGKLDLDGPVQRLVPELPYAEVTLRHLLSHTSGIPARDYDYFDPFLGATDVRTTERLLAVLDSRRPPLASRPGTAFEYSSLGFDVAALAAGRAARSTYAQLLADRFFRPLRMTSAFVRPARLQEFPGIRTLAYRNVNGQRQLHDVFDLEGFHGGSNIYVSAGDLHRWNASFFNPPLLDRAVLARLLEPGRVADAPSGLTLGSWYYSPEKSAFWYSGHLQGFHSEVFRHLPSRASIVYISNNTIKPWLQHALVRGVMAILRGDRSPQPIREPDLREIGVQDYSSLAGSWLLTSGDRLLIERSGPDLAVVRDGVWYRMVQVHGRAFYVPGIDVVIGFSGGLAGEAGARIYVSSHLAERWGRQAAQGQVNRTIRQPL